MQAAPEHDEPGSVLAIVPARLGSMRFPRKVLADATGKPLVQHVAEAAGRATLVDRVIVATDSEEVVAALTAFDTDVVLTKAEHASGTDRCAEVVARLETSPELVVNVQGDEPELDPASLDDLVAMMRSSGCGMGTLVASLPKDVDVNDPNRVKAVVAEHGPFRRAMYFSRAPVPYDREGVGIGRWLHVGVYAYRPDVLRELASLPPSPLEEAERLEQLRALEHGHSIGVVEVARAHAGIDTPEQYDAFVRRHRRGGG